MLSFSSVGSRRSVCHSGGVQNSVQNHEAPNGGQDLETLVGEWTTVPDIVESTGLDVRELRRLLDVRAIVAVPIGERGVKKIPARFFRDGEPLDSLKGTIQVLTDAGYSDEELIGWLFTEDETLPGSPMDALEVGRKTEVRRRASALAW